MNEANAKGKSRQIQANYIEWSDNARTEGNPSNEHMKALFARAEREGLTIERETW